jgi:hypothetical protein
MTNQRRFLANLLLPPPVAASVGIFYAALTGSSKTAEGGFVTLVIFAFIGCWIYGLVPSIIYALVAQFFYRQGMVPGSRKAIIVAVSFGTVVAIAYLVFWTLLIAIGRHQLPLNMTVRSSVEYILTGSCTGLIVGLILMSLDRHTSK